MSEESNSTSGLRFRLPKLFSESGKVESASPVAGEAEATQKPNAPQPAHTTGMATSPQAPGPGPITPTILSQQISTHSNQIVDEIVGLRSDVELLQQAFVELGNRESQQEKVFNALHKELGDYKNDFIYEHLKPVIRPLLFLYDSIEQFEGEVAASGDDSEAGYPLSPRLVRDNVIHFRDQLVEALLVCEVTLMENPEGTFDAKLHKAVQVVPVDADQDNLIQRVVRSGWYLRGQIFRPAEVVLGRSQVR